MKHKKYQSGFTLIEVMIVVVIVAVLSSIAYPSYKESVARSRRAEARVVLTAAQQWMERFYTENNRYDQSRATPPVAVALPAGLAASPKEGATKYYNLSFSGAVGQNSYTLQAVPTGAQSSDGCKTLTLTNTGARGLTGSPTKTVNECWR